MFGDLFKSVTDVASDVVKVAVAPVKIAADVTRVVTKPLADVAEAAVEEVKEITDDITSGRAL